MTPTWISFETVSMVAVATAILFWTFFRSLRVDPNAFTSMLFLFPLTAWLGYFLTPLLDLFWGGWYGSLLVEKFIPYALAFALLSMVAFILGYLAVHPSSRKMRRHKAAVRARYSAMSKTTIRTPYILILALILFGLTLFVIGGPEQLFYADYSRGALQWESNFVGILRKLAKILTNMLTILLGLVLGAKMSGKRLLGRNFVLVFTVLTIACVPDMFEFGRLSGAPLIAFGVTYAIMSKRFPYIVVTALVSLFLLFAHTGYSQRSEFRPGLANFAEAVIAPRETSDKNLDPFNPGADNPINAVDRWTLRALSKSYETPLSAYARIVSLVGALQPLPSRIVNMKAAVGESLSSFRGLEGTIGITTPAFGELYYLGGLWAAGFFFFYGILASWFDKQTYLNPSVSVLLMRLMVSLGFVIGLHLGLRPMTRPMIYAVVLFVVLPWFIRGFSRRVG